MIKLSLCIPIYNRSNVFEVCLINACESCLGFEAYVEIIVVDDASQEDIRSIVSKVAALYPSVMIHYSRNDQNLGLALNFLEVVQQAQGDFAWIIGGDDFLKKDAVSVVLELLEQNIDFLSVNYDLIDIHDSLETEFNAIELKLNLGQNNTIIHHAPQNHRLLISFEELIHPEYNNVMLGAMMVGIFRRSLWLSVKIDYKKLKGEDLLSTLYPHSSIYAQAFMGKKASYYSQPLITVGEGVREWTTDTGLSFWNSSLPIIHFQVLVQMLLLYRRNGLSDKLYLSNRDYVAELSGYLLMPLLIEKFIKRTNIRYKKQYRIWFVVSNVGWTKPFVKSLAHSLVCLILGKEVNY